MSNYAQRRKWAHEESMQLLELRPLRNAVNNALRGLPHSKSHTTRIRGWHHWTFGWESRSDTYAKRVIVDFNHRDSIRGPSVADKQRMAELIAEARKRLAHLNPEWDGERIVIQL